MDVSPPKPPVLPSPVSGPPPIADSPAPSPGHLAPIVSASVASPLPSHKPAVQEKPKTEPLIVKQAPLANLEVEENNSPATPPPLSSEELKEASKEVKEDERRAAEEQAHPKKPAPTGPRPPVAFIVMTVLFMVVLSGLAVAVYMTSRS